MTASGTLPARGALRLRGFHTAKCNGYGSHKLYKGNCVAAGVKSPYSLYNEEYATFGEDAVYDQKDAAGFINLLGLPLTVRAKMKQNHPEAK